MPNTYSLIWIIGAVIVLAVCIMSVVFLIKSIKRAKAIGMESSTIKKIITNKVNIPKVTAIIINKSLLLIAEDKTIFLIKLDITIIQP